MRTLRSTFMALAALGIGALGAHAAGEQPGRFTLSPADGGAFIRLDTQTGAMALCRQERSEWSCKPMSGDDTAQRQEMDRLRTENQSLKAEIRRLEELVLPPERGAGTRPPASEGGKPPGGLQLPTEEEFDRALSYLDRMWKRFQERMRELEPKDKGTPL